MFQLNVVEGLSSIQFLLNSNFYIIDTTEKTALNLGYKKEELIGRNIKYIIEEFNKQNILIELKNNKSITLIYKIKKKDNTKNYVNFNFFKLLNKKNETDGFVLIGYDNEIKQKFEFQSNNERITRDTFSRYFENLLTFIENFKEAIALFDEKARIQAANKSFLKYFYLLKEDILSLKDLYESKKETIEKIIEKEYNGQRRFYKYSLKSILKNSHDPNFNKFEKGSDVIYGYLVLIEDISDKIYTQIKMENSYKIFQNLISKFPLGLLIFNDEGKILNFSNKLVRNIKNKVNFDSVNLNELKTESYFNKAFIQLIETGYSELRNFKLNLKSYFDFIDIENFICNLYLFTISNDHKIYSMIIEDLSQFEKYRRNIEKIKNKLDLSIDEKTSFLSSLSYELRKFLLDIIELLNLIRYYIEPSKNEYIEKMLISSEDLLGQIDSIILYELLENNQVELFYGEVNLTKAIRETIQKYNNLAIEKGLVFNYFITDSLQLESKKTKNDKLLKHNQNYNNTNVLLDVTFFEKIIEIILSNSLKFTNSGFINCIFNIKSLGDENIELDISIKDSGIGIKEENLRIIFNKYYQIDYTLTKRFKGLGLGLYNLKKILNYFGGSITIDSIENKGTTVNAVIPLTRSINSKKDKIDQKKQIDINNLKFIFLTKNSYISKFVEPVFKLNNINFQYMVNESDFDLNQFKDFHTIFVFNIDYINSTEIINIKEMKDKYLSFSQKTIFLGIYSFPFFDKKLKSLQNIIDIFITRPIKIENIIRNIEEFISNKYEKLF